MVWSILAAKEQKKGLNKAQDIVWQMYEKSRDDLEPAREAGQWAMTQAQSLLQGGIPNYEQTPEYNYSYNQGIRALRENAAVSGNLDSSGFQKDLYRFGKNEALNDVDRFYNRWLSTRFQPVMQLAGLGTQTGVIPSVQLNQQTGDSLGNIQISKGNARAGMYTGIGNAVMQGASLGAGVYGGMNPATTTIGLNGLTAGSNTGNQGFGLYDAYNTFRGY